MRIGCAGLLLIAFYIYKVILESCKHNLFSIILQLHFFSNDHWEHETTDKSGFQYKNNTTITLFSNDHWEHETTDSLVINTKKCNWYDNVHQLSCMFKVPLITSLMEHYGTVVPLPC